MMIHDLKINDIHYGTNSLTIQQKIILPIKPGFAKSEHVFAESCTVGLIILILIYHKNRVASFVPFNSFTTKGTKKHC